MKLHLDCIPCFFRITLETARAYGVDEAEQRQILARFSQVLFDLPSDIPPPQVTTLIYRLLRGYRTSRDVYYKAKKESTRQVLAVYPELKNSIELAKNPLKLAVELAAAGNVIDFGFRKSTDISGEIKAIIDNISGSGRAHLDFKPFERTLKKAKTVLVVGDNAGETVFDRLLLEEIGRLYPGKKIYYAVRGYPALNDALMEDAFDAGLDKVATVITSGSDLPGTLVDQCTAEFRTLFKNADLVISKGQGNYETLTEETREIFYIFMVKCAMVSQDSGKPMGSYLLYHSKARKKK